MYVCLSEKYIARYVVNPAGLLSIDLSLFVLRAQKLSIRAAGSLEHVLILLAYSLLDAGRVDRSNGVLRPTAMTMS